MTPLTQVRDGRSRLPVVVAAVIALLPWFPSPGRIVADTKIDLVLDPWAYLARAQSAWDSHAFFGQLQNQANGYLFPMGPFFGVGRSLGIPEWACQRMWWSLVLVTAFVGCYLLIRRLELAGPRVAVVAAFAFAASPRMLTVLGPISIEGWPSAIAPWLVLGAHRLLHAQGLPERRRAAALLGLGVFAIGGVNATATIAALALPTLYLATAGRRGWRLLPWWMGAVILGTLWWLVPLLVLGAYAYPFLDFIETSSITTAVTSIPNVLRGTSHWVAFVPGQFAGGAWPAGSQLVSSTLLLGTAAGVALAGLCSLMTRGWWHAHRHVRSFALVSVVLGVSFMAMGFGANLSVNFVSPFAEQLRDLLDASLAALRNVHKFDPMVRLPVCLGLAVGLSSLVRALSGRRRVVAQTVACLAVVTAALPLFQTTLTPSGSFAEVPDRWREAARSVDALAASQGGATLVAPATRFGEFVWGDTEDDPLEALATSPIVNRDAIPLGNPGAIRQMDALDGVLSSGRPNPHLTDVLARAGIGRVVVPHDYVQHQSGVLLDPAAVGTAELVEQTLRGSGLRLVRSWGRSSERLSLWTTGAFVADAELMDVSDAVSVTGGPEAIVQLAMAGALDAERPYVLADSGLGQTENQVQTDTLKKRVLDVSRGVRDQYSDTLQSDETPSTTRRVRDFPPAGTAPETTRAFRGVEHVGASSTSADPTALLFRGASSGIAAAFDSDYSTAWISGGDQDPSLWFRLSVPTQVGTLAVRLATQGTGPVERVELTVDGKTTSQRVAHPERDLTFAVNRRITSVKIKLIALPATPALPVGVANVAATGLTMSTGLQLPTGGDGSGQVVVSRDPWTSFGPGRTIDDGRVLTRYVDVDGPRRAGTVMVQARPTARSEQLLDGWKISGPRWESDIRTRPGAALDEDSNTRWTVGYLAGDPQLSIGWDSPQTVTGLAGLAKGPTKAVTVNNVTITDPDTGEQRVWSRKSTRFAPLTARRVVVTLHLPSKASYPFSVPDFSLRGVETAPASRPKASVDVPCDDGATVDIGGGSATYSATYSATVKRSQLLDGSAVEAKRCAGATPTSTAEELTIRGTSGDVFEIRSIVTDGQLDAAQGSSAAKVESWTNRERRMQVDRSPSDRVVVWHEGFNRGWVATLGGETLKAVEIDGWRQAFVVPAGSAGLVTAHFAPDRAYRAGLLGGAAAVLALIVLASWPVRRSSPDWVENKPVRRSQRAISVGASLLAVAVGFVLGGMTGGAVGVVAALIGWTRWRVNVALAAAALLIVSSAHWVLPIDNSAWSILPQALGLFVVCLLARELGASVSPGQDGALNPPVRHIGNDEGEPQGQRSDEQG